MPLSKAQRRKLRDKGYTTKEIREVEADLDGDDDDGDDDDRRTPRRSKGGRVTVHEGAAADSFLDRFFGKDGDDGDDDEEEEETSRGGRSKGSRRSSRGGTSRRSKDEEDDEDGEDEDDDQPRKGPRYFGGRDR